MCNAPALVQKAMHRLAQLLRPLQRREMADAGQQDQLRTRNAASKVLGVLELDELVMLGVDDGDGHLDLGQVARRVVRLRPLHQADRFGEGLELAGRRRQPPLVPGGGL